MTLMMNPKKELYKAKSFDGKEVIGEVVNDGLDYYIKEDLGYGTSLVKVFPITIEKIGDDLLNEDSKI